MSTKRGGHKKKLREKKTDGERGFACPGKKEGRGEQGKKKNDKTWVQLGGGTQKKESIQNDHWGGGAKKTLKKKKTRRDR